MSRFARIDSIDVIRDFRAGLLKTGVAIKLGLGEAEADLQRVSEWLKHDAYRHWKSELARRTQAVAQAKLALQQKKNFFKSTSGATLSCVDEERALAKAKRRLEEAERKFENTRTWIRRFDEEMFNYKGRTRGMTRFTETEIPNAAAQLDQMLDALDAYLATRGAPEEQASAAADDYESIARGEPSAESTDPASAASKEKRDQGEPDDQQGESA